MEWIFSLKEQANFRNFSVCERWWHSFNKYFLRICSVLGAVPDMEDRRAKRQYRCPQRILSTGDSLVNTHGHCEWAWTPARLCGGLRGNRLGHPTLQVTPLHSGGKMCPKSWRQSMNFLHGGSVKDVGAMTFRHYVTCHTRSWKTGCSHFVYLNFTLYLHYTVCYAKHYKPSGPSFSMCKIGTMIGFSEDWMY